MAYIEFDHVVKEYPSGSSVIRALDEASFTADQGELSVILGQSGAGKTTALNILGGMDTATSGRVIVGDRDITGLRKRDLVTYRRNDIGFVFQFYNLVPNLTPDGDQKAESDIEVCMNGKKDVLGMYVGENESAKFWLSIMNGLKNRGVEDILIACVDGLNGFPQAIEAVYPKTEIQQCIIHQIRNSTKFVSYKDIKKLMADLKLVYAAPTEETALNELELFKDKWDSKYPKIYKSWHDNWATLSTYFKYPEAVRRLIYTTNAIEGFNRQLRKVTKSKTVFPSDDSLLKMLYLATMDITKKWTGHRQDWGQIHSQLEIYFEERLIGRNL